MADYFSAFASYTIYFDDPDEYNFAVSIAGGTQLWTNPQNAAGMFDIAWPPATVYTGAKGIFAGSDDFSIISPGSEIKNPAPSGLFMDPGVDSVEVPSQIPNPDPQIPNDSKPTIFFWSGFIAMGGNADIDNPPDGMSFIPRRRWAAGFEYFDQAEGETDSLKCIRDASRTVEGFGGILRNDFNKQWTKTVAKFRPAYTPATATERFYLRIRMVGTEPLDIWRNAGTVNGGTRIYIDNATLLVKIYNVTNLGVETQMGESTFSLVTDSWYQFLMAFTFNTSAVGGAGAYGLNMVGFDVPDRFNEVCDYDVPAASGGQGANSQRHVSSTLGTSIAGLNNGWEIDFDDWIGMDYPNNGSIDTPTSLDFISGSHVKSVRVVAAGPLEIGWAGEVDYMNQMLNPTAVAASSQLTSITPLATLDGVTNADNGGASDMTGINYGAVCAIISKYGQRLIGTNDGQLGYSVAGGAAVLTPIVESTSLIYNEVAYLPSGVKVPTPIAPFDVIHEKGNSTDTARVNALSAVIEYIGVWGPEDDQFGRSEVKPINYHNCFYPSIAAAAQTPDPSAPVAGIGGTYVGNGTTTVIQIDLPAHWIMIRPLTNNDGGAIWMATGVGGHKMGQEGVLPPHMVRVVEEGGAIFIVITSALAAINALGVTYQFTAFCDPTMRYNLCASLCHDSSIVTADYPLIIEEWEPEGAFFQFELQGTSTLTKFIFKGIGSSGNTGTQVDGTAKSNVGSFDTGVLTTRADVHRQGIQTTFSLWRHDDCSGFAMIQLHTYTGNGSASRVITLPDETGCYPLFVYIQPHNAKGWFRDPSHTGAHASDMLTAADSVNAIIAGGVDSITVGIDCNANVVDYEVFVIMGDTAGWNNGIFYAPTIPCDWFIDPPTVVPGDINVLGEGGLMIGGNPAIIALQDVSGIYTLTANKTNDTLYDRQTGQTNVDVKIPDPKWKTGYIGG